MGTLHEPAAAVVPEALPEALTETLGQLLNVEMLPHNLNQETHNKKRPGCR